MSQVDKYLGTNTEDMMMERKLQIGRNIKTEIGGLSRNTKGRKNVKVENVKEKKLKIKEVKEQKTLSITNVKGNSKRAIQKIVGESDHRNVEDAFEDANSVSDDDSIIIEDGEQFLRKRKLSHHQEEPRQKKQRGEKNIKQLIQNPEHIKVTPLQEEVLLATFREWPLVSSSLMQVVQVQVLERWFVQVLEQETGLASEVVERWFLQTREDCLRILWDDLGV